MKRRILCGALGALALLGAAAESKEKKAETPPAVDLLCPEVKAKKEKTPEQKRQTTLRKMLTKIALGGAPDAADKNGQTALMHAAAQGNRPAVCWLVAKGADVARRSAKGKTALSLATDPDIKELLQACADEKKTPTAKEKERVAQYGQSGQELREGIFTRCRDLPEIATAQKLGCDLSGTHEGRLLVQCGLRPEVYAYLVRTGYSVDARGENGETALTPEMPRDLAQLMLALGMQINPENAEQALWAALYADDAEGVTAALGKNPGLLGSSAQEGCKYIRHAGSGDVVKALIAAGLNAKDTWEENGKQVSLLHTAIMGGGNAKVVKELLAAGCPLPGKGEGLLGLLIHHCPQAGATAKLLVEAGAEVTDGNLSAAIDAHSLPLVKLALEKGANAKQELGDPPLTLLHRLYPWDPHKDTPAIADLLIKAGLDINSTRMFFYMIRGGGHLCREATPLHIALLGLANQTRRGDYHWFHDPALAADRELKINIIRSLIGRMKKAPADILLYAGGEDLTPRQWGDIALLLLDKGADPKAQTSEGLTTLMTIGCFDARVAKRLIEAGVDVNAQGKYGETALGNARTPEVVDVLLAAGASKNSAIAEQMEKGVPGCITPVVKRLLEAGAPTEGALVALGARGGHSVKLRDEDLTAVAKELIAAGAKIDLLRADAWWQINPTLLKPILASGIDLNTQNDDGNTVMMLWLSQNKLTPDTLKLLLQAGAKTDLRNKDGKTALQLAEEKKNDQLITLLKAFSPKN